jgi:pimeloyl-ACP methyl ester carboxylesterase
MNALLFIHGFPFDHRMWRHQVAAFPETQRIAPDLRGAGANRGPEARDEYSMHTYATDLVRLLDNGHIDQAVICGLSMGGYIAFELLRRFPGRVRAAILCNTKASADSLEAKQGRDAMMQRARTEGASGIARELVPKLLARPPRPELAREVTEMISRQPVSGIVGALHAMRGRPDSTPLLGQIRVPVLVLAGDNDQIVPAAGMEEMARAIPGAQFVLIRGSGHLSPLEEPAAFNDALKAFL